MKGIESCSVSVRIETDCEDKTMKAFETDISFELKNGKVITAKIEIDSVFDETFDAEKDLDNPGDREQVYRGVLDPVCVQVSASYNGISHTEYLGGCLVSSPKDVMACAVDYNMLRESVDGLKEELERLLKDLNTTKRSA